MNMHVSAIIEKGYMYPKYAAVMLASVLHLAICRIFEAVYVYSGMNCINDRCNTLFLVESVAEEDHKIISSKNSR